jgi:AcrR family transcriptional regulator
MSLDVVPGGESVRSRPADRRQRILAAAAAQFWARGYHQVGMADIAAPVGIAPSAVYRHFRGKQELLLAILDAHLSHLEQAAAAPGRDITGDLAAFALEHREFGVIWEREAGHLPAQQQRALRHRLRTVAGTVSGGGPEAGLRGWAVLSVVGSPSHHRVQNDPARFGQLLRAAIHAVRDVPLLDGLAEAAPASAPPDRPHAPGLIPASRREALLGAAVRLFRERGYPSVGLSDIGAAVGIAGPSVYNHFGSKNEILDAALNRGTEALWLGLHHALATAERPSDALERVAADYAAFATANTGIVRLVVTELIHLPEDRRREYRRTQINYINEWITLLSASRPDLTGPDARILVQTAIALINSLTRIPHLPAQPGRLATLARAVLTADAPHPNSP